MKNPFSSTRVFVMEMVGELQKAAWPTRRELWNSTVVVIFTVILLGLFCSIADFSMNEIVTAVTAWVS